MRRTIVTAALPVLVVALAWLRQESPARGWEVLAVAALALVPALGSRLRWRLALAAAGAFVVAWLGMEAEPWGLVPGAPGEWLRPVGHAFQTGLGDYYEVVLPFDPTERWEMHGLLLLAAYVTGVAITLLVASGRNVAAILVLAAGVAWPAVPVEGRGALALGALTLVAALWLLLVPRIQGRSAALAGGLAVIAVLCVATGCRVDERAGTRSVARLEELGLLRRQRRSGERRLRVECELHGHRLPETAHDPAQDRGAPPGALLACVHARHVRRWSLDREPLPDLDRRAAGDRARPADARGRAEPRQLDRPAGRGRRPGRRAPGRSRHAGRRHEQVGLRGLPPVRWCPAGDGRARPRRPVRDLELRSATVARQPAALSTALREGNAALSRARERRPSRVRVTGTGEDRRGELPRPV